MKLLKTRDDLPGDLPAEETHYEAVKKNILIVDDSGFARKILKDMLESEGYNIVGEAGDGLEAIEMAKEKKPDFIFMDVAMPKLDGMGALPRIMEMNLNSKVIMSTAMGQKSIIVEAMKIGAIDYVIKPYKKENIMDVLNTHLEAEAKNSQVISFEEERKHYIKEKTREAAVRDIKENVVKKEEKKEEEKVEAKAAVSEEVPKETAPVETAEAETAEKVIEEETLEVETEEETAMESNEEAAALELNDEAESLELVTDEESLELVTEEKGLEGTLDSEGTTDSERATASEEISEITDLEGISDTNETSKEESLQALDMEESTASVTDEAALETDSGEESLEAASQEESLNILDTEETLNIEESEKTAVKEAAPEMNSGAESPIAAVNEGMTGELAGGTAPGQTATEAVREEPVGNISGQTATEVTTGEKGSAIVAGQVIDTAASGSVQAAPEIITAEKPFVNATVQGTPEVPIGEQTAATAAVQEVTEAVSKAEVPEAVLNTDAAAIGYESPQISNGEAERYSFMTSIRREEEDTESAVYSYLWKNRFDARNDENSARRTLNEGNYVQNFCGLSTNGNDLSEEENSEQNMLFAMVNAYMNLNSRFDSENVTGQYLFRPYEGIRLPTVRVFGSEWYGRDEVSLSNILRYSNYNASQDRVYYEKNSLYLVVMHLVQSKADRILGQDRFKIFH